jgi:hypothetical protein
LDHFKYLAEIAAHPQTIEVAWCTKPRNNARVIPDGTITGISFLKTDFYVQIMGNGDFTKLNIANGDFGGELDPHGAYGTGNPIGGNVTTNVVDGVDEPIQEWMLYIDYNQFCLRACTNANSTCQFFLSFFFLFPFFQFLMPILQTAQRSCVGTS